MIDPNAVTFSLSPLVLWVIFGILVIVVTIMSFVLIYHWNKYSLGEKMLQGARQIYLAGVIILAIVTTIGLIVFSI